MQYFDWKLQSFSGRLVSDLRTSFNWRETHVVANGLNCSMLLPYFTYFSTLASHFNVRATLCKTSLNSKRVAKGHDSAGGTFSGYCDERCNKLLQMIDLLAARSERSGREKSASERCVPVPCGARGSPCRAAGTPCAHRWSNSREWSPTCRTRDRLQRTIQ